MTPRAAITALAALAVLAMPGWAAAPELSPRPVGREDASGAASDPAPRRPRMRPSAETAAPPLRPRVRPLSAQAAAVAAAAPGTAFFGPDTSPIPMTRPDDVERKALFGRRKRRKGAVCGDIDIQGDRIGQVPGRIKGCGVQDAVRVRSISGVTLSQPSVMDCTTARALKSWVDNGVRLSFRPEGRVAGLKVAAHYACRTRNNQRGARISEHGKGRAIDISAFVMKDGQVITVARGWQGPQRTKKMLQRAWKTACGPFGTVLGPNSDRFHRDHFHLDTARYRGGPYCR